MLLCLIKKMLFELQNVHPLFLILHLNDKFNVYIIIYHLR